MVSARFKQGGGVLWGGGCTHHRGMRKTRAMWMLVSQVDPPWTQWMRARTRSTYSSSSPPPWMRNCSLISRMWMTKKYARPLLHPKTGSTTGGSNRYWSLLERRFGAAEAAAWKRAAAAAAASHNNNNNHHHHHRHPNKIFLSQPQQQQPSSSSRHRNILFWRGWCVWAIFKTNLKPIFSKKMTQRDIICLKFVLVTINKMGHPISMRVRIIISHRHIP